MWFSIRLSLWSVLILAAACGGSSNTNPNAGFDPNCTPASGNTLNTSCNPGFTQQSPNKPGSIQVTFSGELLGESNGLTFDPSVSNLATQFVDGWSMQFDELLVVIGNFRLSPGATQYAAQNTLNPTVATKAGPYVVDMHNPPHSFTAAAGEPAGALFKWDTQDNGQAFDTSVRYAFSYDTFQAKYPVANVNLTAAQQADYDLMVQNGWSKLYRGTATFVGNPSAGTYPNKAKFDAMPQTVKFFFGFNDATSYINCVNPDNAGATGGDDLAARGVQPSPTGDRIAYLHSGCAASYFDNSLEVKDLTTDAVVSIGARLPRCHILTTPRWSLDGAKLAILYGAAGQPAVEAAGWRPALPVAAAFALLLLTGIAWPPGLGAALDRIAAIVVP